MSAFAKLINERNKDDVIYVIIFVSKLVLTFAVSQQEYVLTEPDSALGDAREKQKMFIYL